MASPEDTSNFSVKSLFPALSVFDHSVAFDALDHVLDLETSLASQIPVSSNHAFSVLLASSLTTN